MQGEDNASLLVCWFVGGGESDGKPLQTKKNTGTAEEKKENAKWSTCSRRGKMSMHKEIKFMKSNTLGSIGGSGEDLTSPSPRRFD